MTVSPGPATTLGTFNLNVTGTSGLLTHSTATQLTVQASAGGTGKVIDGITAAGCIDNSGISGALINKVNQAQRFIDAGQIQNAVNTLSALLNQLQAQSGKHISLSCTVDGQTFNPVDVLINDVLAILATLPGASAPNPIMGYVVNGSNAGIPGVTVSILNTPNTATTDATGFYFFANTGGLSLGSSYTAKATGLSAGFESSTPASQIFKWQGQADHLRQLCAEQEVSEMPRACPVASSNSSRITETLLNIHDKFMTAATLVHYPHPRRS
jgi:hypothetical protein